MLFHHSLPYLCSPSPSSPLSCPLPLSQSLSLSSLSVCPHSQVLTRSHRASCRSLICEKPVVASLTPSTNITLDALGPLWHAVSCNRCVICVQSPHFSLLLLSPAFYLVRSSHTLNTLSLSLSLSHTHTHTHIHTHTYSNTHTHTHASTHTHTIQRHAVFSKIHREMRSVSCYPHLTLSINP